MPYAQDIQPRVQIINAIMADIEKAIQQKEPTLPEVGVIALTLLRTMVEHSVGYRESFPKYMEMPLSCDYTVSFTVKKTPTAVKLPESIEELDRDHPLKG